MDVESLLRSNVKYGKRCDLDVPLCSHNRSHFVGLRTIANVFINCFSSSSYSPLYAANLYYAIVYK